MNWGHKIAIIYVAFMAFMISMLFISKGYDHELVTEDYYARELAFQEKIDARNNLNNSALDVQVKLVEGELKLVFDELPPTSSITGEIKFYKPDNELMDQTYPIKLEENHSEMPISTEGKFGRYKVQVSFKLDGKPFYKEQELML